MGDQTFKINLTVDEPNLDAAIEIGDFLLTNDAFASLMNGVELSKDLEVPSHLYPAYDLALLVARVGDTHIPNLRSTLKVLPTNEGLQLGMGPINHPDQSKKIEQNLNMLTGVFNNWLSNC